MIDLKKGKYWDRAWQLTSGCSPYSPGCLHCWSAAAAHMRQFQKNPKIRAQYQGLTYLRDGVPTFTGTVRLHEDRLDLPLRTRKPTVWAVWDDLYHREVTFLFQLSAWQTMRDSRFQTFLVLTKRPDRMLYFFERLQSGGNPIVDKIWNGLTICTQLEADEKIPIFLQIPGNKFLSVEPILEYIDLQMALEHFQPLNPDFSRKPHPVNLVIVGPETGPHRRPCDINLIRDVKDQCQAAGVPLFIKALDLNGKISRDMAEWPADLRVRQLPWL